MIALRLAESPADLETVRMLFREYADGLGFDLGFQDFERELAELPGKYAEPAGCIVLAEEDGARAGCIAIRPLEPPELCEMKRLYVSASHRGRGAGRLLALAALQEARSRGYGRMRLDTVPAMGSAISLYRSLGFREIDPYRQNPIAGALFFERTL